MLMDARRTKLLYINFITCSTADIENLSCEHLKLQDMLTDRQTNRYTYRHIMILSVSKENVWPIQALVVCFGLL